MTGASVHPAYQLPNSALFRQRAASSRRSSSWDRSGANIDYFKIQGGHTVTLLDVEGPGCVTHLYAGFVLPDLRDYRNAIIRCYWDGSDTPSVEVPFGDFFTLAHARTREISSSMVAVNAGYGASHGLNAYFPMPFGDGARITLENRGDTQLGGLHGGLWFHVEYETYSQPLPDDVQRFHASWRQERPTGAVGPEPNVMLHGAENLTGAENYVALDTKGEGRMVGLVLQIENIQGAIWYGEGDDMVFIDGEQWPPSIHGTGTEEIFGGGACPTVEYASLNSGFHLVESADFAGLIGMYRWYVNDPIHFSTSLKWTLEHGHANNFTNNYSSVAYWYQSPQGVLPPLPPAADMLPPLDPEYDELWQIARDIVAARKSSTNTQDSSVFAMAAVWACLNRGEMAEARELLTELQKES
jgi:hypothetical protein